MFDAFEANIVHLLVTSNTEQYKNGFHMYNKNAINIDHKLNFIVNKNLLKTLPEINFHNRDLKKKIDHKSIDEKDTYD